MIRGRDFSTVDHEDGVETVASAPMLVSFQPEGAQGLVVFASFHVDAQNAGAVDQLLKTVIGEFEDPTTVSEVIGE